MSERLYVVKSNDGLHLKASVFRSKDSDLDPSLNESDMVKLVSPEDSLRHYYNCNPKGAINKSHESDRVKEGKKIFRFVYSKFPYLSLKKKFYSCDKSKMFTDIISFYVSVTRSECDVRGFVFEDLFIGNDLYHYLTNEFNNERIRKTRFENKAYLNNWDYFVTLTYSDELCPGGEDEFIFKVKNLTRNLKYKYGWLFIGTFEKGSDNDRLHYHGLVNINHHFLGSMKLIKDYSVKHKYMRAHFECDYFSSRLGRNEFGSIDFGNNPGEARAVVEYCTKYSTKTSIRFLYSRGIKSFVAFFYDSVNEDEIIAFLNEHFMFYYDTIFNRDDVIPVPMRE